MIINEANVKANMKKAGYNPQNYIQNPYIGQTVVFFTVNGKYEGKVLSHIVNDSYTVEVPGNGGGKFKISNMQMFS